MKQKEQWACDFIGGNPNDDSRLFAQHEAWLSGFEFAKKEIREFVEWQYAQMIDEVGESEVLPLGTHL